MNIFTYTYKDKSCHYDDIQCRYMCQVVSMLLYSKKTGNDSCLCKHKEWREECHGIFCFGLCSPASH